MVGHQVAVVIELMDIGAPVTINGITGMSSLYHHHFHHHQQQHGKTLSFIHSPASTNISTLGRFHISCWSIICIFHLGLILNLYLTLKVVVTFLVVMALSVLCECMRGPKNLHPTLYLDLDLNKDLAFVMVMA